MQRPIYGFIVYKPIYLFILGSRPHIIEGHCSLITDRCIHAGSNSTQITWRYACGWSGRQAYCWLTDNKSHIHRNMRKLDPLSNSLLHHKKVPCFPKEGVMMKIDGQFCPWPLPNIFVDHAFPRRSTYLLGRLEISERKQNQNLTKN